MASVKICDGRTSLFRYDVGVQIEMCGCSRVTECHFVTADGVIKRDVANNICNVPDAALTQAGVLVVYAFSRTENEGTTRHEFRILVQDRPKPADYIDPPDEMDGLDQIVQRVVDRIGDISGGIVEEKDPTVPAWAKQPNPPAAPVQSVNGKTGDVQINASDVGALPVDSIKASASGAVVSVTDAAARPVVGLVSKIEAVQDGEGDPSPDNVRPIRGWDRAQVINDTSGQTLTADLPETVYGGTLDWVTGVLQKRVFQELTGRENWQEFAYVDGEKQWFISDLDVSIGSAIICNLYKSIAIADRWKSENNLSTYTASKAIAFRDDRFANMGEWKEYLSELAAAGTPLQVCYELTTPEEIQLTPQQLDMLKGANAIWSDTGNTDLVYVADLQMYIDQRIAAIAAASIGQ